MRPRKSKQFPNVGLPRCPKCRHLWCWDCTQSRDYENKTTGECRHIHDPDGTCYMIYQKQGAMWVRLKRKRIYTCCCCSHTAHLDDWNAAADKHPLRSAAASFIDYRDKKRQA